ncbi:MAG: bacteriohemerythrin [Bryobacteraceae bacterium]
MPDSAVIDLIQWTPDYAVGVPQIDQEHQGLFAKAESMRQAMLVGKGKDELDFLLGNLVAYGCYHFDHEEELMQRIGYPDIAEHRKEHEDMKKRVRAMQERASAGEKTMTIEVMLFLMEWVKRHVIATDLRIAGYMKARGISLAH